jgi:hypothetical protein
MALFSWFISNPLGRKIGASVLLIIALFITIKIIEHRAFEAGKKEGINVGIKDTEEKLRPMWEQREASLEREQRALEDDVTKLKEENLNYAKIIAARVAGTKATAEALDKSRKEAVDRVMANPPQGSDPLLKDLEILGIQNGDLLARATAAAEELLIARNEITFLKQSVDEIANLNMLQELKYEERIEKLEDWTASLNNSLMLAEQQRDFYKASLEAATKKRGCGLFKKIITIGLCGR